jgi:TetR/AcrR family transcriptional regulator
LSEVATRITRDPVATRARILAAAVEEFAHNGFAGARVAAIAETAGANKRMLYHYFGSKDGLYVAVLEHVYDRARSAEHDLDLEQLPPVEAMRRMVGFTFDSFVGDRSFIQLLNDENLNEARYLKQSARIPKLHSPLIGMIERILDRGTAAGLFRDGTDPTQLWISIAAISYFYFSNIYTLSTIFGRDLGEASALAERREHAIAVILGYLRP